MYEDENLVLEDTENVEEQTTEETVQEQVEEPVKTYTEDELNARVDELLAKKIARKEAKIRKQIEKEYEPYKELGTVVGAGLGTSDIKDATSNLRDFYTKKGVTIPTVSPSLSESDLRVLANSEANDIIESGYDDVVDEVDRLAKIGAENMTSREKQVFQKLAEYRTQEERKRELASAGVSTDVLESNDFKDFAEQFNPKTPISKVYELYTKSADTAKPEKIGSMKNGNTQEEKDYYTPDEVDKLTEKDYDDPKIFEKVRRSMQKW